MRKKQSGRGVDLVSALPDSLLIHILSLLSEPAGLSISDASFRSYPLQKAADVKKTAITSVLSKRWRYVWAELPVLSFQEQTRDMEKISKFVDMVSRTLAIRNADYLEKFYLQFRFSQIWAPNVNECLVFALKSKAKVVSLVFWTGENTVRYALPEMFYCNSWLKELELLQCRVAPQGRIDWRCLSRIEFYWVELGEDVIENMLTGCPVLYSLGLHYCWGFNRLNINSGSVGKLEVRLEEVDVSVEISAPYVRYLHVASVSGGLVVRDIPSVVKALIDIKMSKGNEVIAKEWVEVTSHIPELFLTWPLFMLVSDMVADGWQIPLSYKRVSLTLETSCAKDEVTILGIMRLLESSPQLDKLEVFTSWLREYELVERHRNDDFSCCRPLRLKTVNIECCPGTDAEDNPLYAALILLLARTLLERASALEKMSIFVIYSSMPACSEFIKILEQLNTYPRSSHKAQILILPAL